MVYNRIVVSYPGRIALVNGIQRVGQVKKLIRSDKTPRELSKNQQKKTKCKYIHSEYFESKWENCHPRNKGLVTIGK